MEKIGTILRNARLDKGISLREVEEATKIRLRYLEALENGEFEQLPGRVYALGFLRSYARFLGLDVKELTERFKAEFPAEEEPYIVEDYSISKPGTERKKFPILLLIGVILFLWGVNFLYKTYQPPVEQPPPPGVNAGEVPQEPPSQVPQPPVAPEPQIEGVEVRLKVSDNCWTEMTIDGSSDFSIYETLRAGYDEVFHGDEEIRLRLGNAGAVEVTVNGKTWPPLGKPGEVVTVTFTPASVPPETTEGDRND